MRWKNRHSLKRPDLPSCVKIANHVCMFEISICTWRQQRNQNINKQTTGKTLTTLNTNKHNYISAAIRYFDNFVKMHLQLIKMCYYHHSVFQRKDFSISDPLDKYRKKEQETVNWFCSLSPICNIWPQQMRKAWSGISCDILTWTSMRWLLDPLPGTTSTRGPRQTRECTLGWSC